MAAVNTAETKNKPIPVVVSPAIKRAITELMATRREFSRSKLIRDAVIEMADRTLPSNWRVTVGLDESDAA